PQIENNPQLPRGLLLGSYYKVYSKADGTFEIAVPAGKGHLLVGAPAAGFVSRTISEGQLRSGTPGGQAHFHHGIVAVDVKASDQVKELTVRLRRGVTIKGKVVGPDGKAPKMAVMFCPGELLPPPQQVLFAELPLGNRAIPVLLK